MISFSQFFTKEMFDAVKLKMSKKDKGDVYHNYLQDNVIKPVVQFLKANRDAGYIKIPVFPKGYSCRVITYFLEVMNDKDVFDQHFDFFSLRHFANVPCFYGNSDYENYIKSVDCGDMYIDAGQCRNTDDYLTVVIDKWDFKLEKYDLATRKFIKAEDCEDIDRIMEVDITFKSGNLIVTDWIDHEKFSKYFRKIDDDVYIPSINSKLGILERTKKYAELNVVHTYAGSDGRNVHTRKNELMVSETCQEWIEECGEKKIDNDGWKCKGCTYNGLWWITILDIETLQDIFGEESNNLVKLFDTKDYVQVKMEPGIYTLKYSYSPSNFNEFMGIKENHLPLSMLLTKKN